MTRRIIVFVLIATSVALDSAPGYADITMNIFDDGSDLFLVASGNYDLTNAVFSKNGTNLGANAAVAGACCEAYGWETGFLTTTRYEAVFSGALTATGDAFPATATITNTPFFFWGLGESINFVSSNPMVGSVNEWAVFENVTVASLGMVPGESITVSWGNDGMNERGTINVGFSVPEPSSVLMGVGGVGCMLVRRRRK